MSESEFMLLDVNYSKRSRSQFLVRVLVVGFAIILGFVVISMIISSNSPVILKRPKFKTHCSQDYEYDYDILTLRWPPSVCENKSCPDFKSDKWVIHGLWPTYNNDSWPQFCCFDRHFNPSDLEPIKSVLMDEWPNLEAGKTSDSLWSHEWTKHGTCTKTKALIYFNSTLNLYKSFPIYEWLKESGILPSNDKTYEISQYNEVLTKKLGHPVLITCPVTHYETKAEAAKPHQITEIRICMSRNTTQVIDCDSKSREECKKPLIYPNYS